MLFGKRSGTEVIIGGEERLVAIRTPSTHELEVVTVHVRRQLPHDAHLSQPSGDGAGTGTAAAHGAVHGVSLRDELERKLADFAAAIHRHVAD